MVVSIYPGASGEVRHHQMHWESVAGIVHVQFQGVDDRLTVEDGQQVVLERVAGAVHAVELDLSETYVDRGVEQ
jgi:hypothetical protein